MRQRRRMCRITRTAALALAAAGLAVSTPAHAASTPGAAIHQAWPPARGGVRPAAGTSADEGLAGVSCMTAANCLAVGHNGTSTLAEQWNGTYWRVIEPAQPGGLDAVSCLSSGCLAVGGSNGVNHAIAWWWNGTSWRQVNPPGTGRIYLGAVDCLSAAYCFTAGSNGQNYSAIWNGQTWRVLNTPNIGGPASGLAAVSCTDASACLAVGWGMPDDEISLATALRWNGTTWTQLNTPPDSADHDSSLAGVSCLSATDCIAAGSGGGSDGTGPLALRWNGAAWTELAAAGSGEFTGVSCVPGGDCIAAGSYPESGEQTAMAQRWDGGSWQDIGALIPPGQASVLNSVSCQTAASCVAVGDDTLDPGGQLPFGETWNGTSWAFPGNPGYLELQSNGSVSNFGTSWYGSPRGTLAGGVRAVAIAADPQTGGYWVLTSNGGVDNYDAPWFGSERQHPDGTAVAIAADPATGGYWILAANGAVDSYNASSFGSDLGKLGQAHAVGIAAAAGTTGTGYWILTSTGGIDAFGAPWLGSERSKPNGTPASLAGDPESSAYWIQNTNGTLDPYGETEYFGTVKGPAVAMVRAMTGLGYWIMTPNGGISNFGAPWYGSLAKDHLSQPPVGLTAG